MRYTETTRLLALATVVALVALVLGGAAAAPPDLFDVNATHDAVDAAPGDGVCADATGACTLRAAVMESNGLAGFNYIRVGAGVYVLAIPGPDEDSAATGDLDFTDSFLMTGAGAANSIVDGAELDRVFDIGPSSAGVIAGFNFLTIRNGSTPSSGGTSDRGGGILNRGLTNLSFSVVADNQAAVGGGIYSEGNFIAWGETEIRNNRAVGTPANAGGGIYNQGTLTVSQSIIDGNSSSRGGGIFNKGEATVGLITTISANAATIGGGGLYNEGTITITESTISGNAGEGLANPGSDVTPGPFGTATLTNSTISGNTGSGIVNGGSLTLTNVTVAENSGAGLAAGAIGSVSLKNSIMGQNSAADCTASPGITSLGHNLDSDGACELSGLGDISKVDPKLGPLADNGGVVPTVVPHTHTHALLAGSPAIDAGDNSGCPVTDQRSIQRPLDGNGDGTAVCDRGAFEADAVTLTPEPMPEATHVPPGGLPRTGGGQG